MNAARRVLLAICSLAIIAAAAGLLALAWGDRQLDMSAGNWQAAGSIQTSGTARLIFTVICGAAGLVGLVSLALSLATTTRGRHRESLRLSQADGSKVRITPEALERLLREQLERLPDVVSADPHVRLRGHNVATEVDVAMLPGTSIAHATSEITNTTAQVYRELVGVAATDRPEISVHYVDRPASATIAPAPSGKLEGEPMTWAPDERVRKQEAAPRS